MFSIENNNSIVIFQYKNLITQHYNSFIKHSMEIKAIKSVNN